MTHPFQEDAREAEGRSGDSTAEERGSQRAFISSTAKDLAEYREAVHEVIRGLDDYEAVRMEDFGPRAAAAEEFCRKKVAECDLLIGIVGLLYGSSPTDSDLSFTEIEYDQAVEKNVPCLMFMAPDNFPLSGDLRESDELWEKQQAFRKRVRSEQITDDFGSPDDLKSRVQGGIRNWEAETAADAAAETAKDGFDALVELTKDPEVRRAVVQYKTAFQIASREIEAVADYKDVHDQLHNLQFRCFDMIVQEAKRFPEDASLDDLHAHEATLGEIIDELSEISDRPSFDGRDIDMEWIRELKEAREKLRSALRDSDEKSLKRALWLINHVLAIQPSAINNQLKASARQLQLDELDEALGILRDRLGALRIDSEKLQQFQSAVDAVATMKHNLGSMADQHDKWQAIETEVRRIENNVNNLVEELVNSWPSLTARTAPLLEGETVLEQDVEHLSAELGTGDDAGIRGSFRRFRRRIASGFHRVDTDLKRRCTDLRQVGRGLTAILERNRECRGHRADWRTGCDVRVFRGPPRRPLEHLEGTFGGDSRRRGRGR